MAASAPATIQYSPSNNQAPQFAGVYGSNTRHFGRLSDGTLVAAVTDKAPTSTNLDIYTSTDGVTWTLVPWASSIYISQVVPTLSDLCMFIDSADTLHFVFKSAHPPLAYNVQYARATFNPTRSQVTRTTQFIVTGMTGSGSSTSVTNFEHPSVVAHPHPTLAGYTTVHVVALQDTQNSSGTRARTCQYVRMTILDSTGQATSTDANVSVGGFGTGSSVNFATAFRPGAHITFHHTGDGKTVAGGTPSVYIGWNSGMPDANAFCFSKVTYAAGAWGAPSAAVGVATGIGADTSALYTSAMGFDGTRVVIAMTFMTGGTPLSDQVYFVRRDEGNTSTTVMTQPARLGLAGLFSGLQIHALPGSTGNDVHLLVIHSGDQLLKYGYLQGGASSWTAFTSPNAAAAVGPNLRVGADGSVEGVYQTQVTNNYTLNYQKLDQVNRPPSAPTLAFLGGVDPSKAFATPWTFSDPDPSSTQRAFREVITDTADGTVALDTGKVVSATQSYTVAAGVLLSGKTYSRTVQTWDDKDLPGAVSPAQTFRTALAPTGSLVVPQASDHIHSATITYSWTYTDPGSLAMSAWQADTYDAAVGGNLVDTTGKRTETGRLSYTPPIVLVSGVTYRVELTLWNSADVPSGTQTAVFVVSFARPPLPVAAATALSDLGYIHVDIDNPAVPSVESQFDMASNVIDANTSDMETDATGWVAWVGSPTLGTTTDWSHSGSNSLELIAPAGNGDIQAISAAAYTVDPSKKFTLRAYVRALDVPRLCDISIVWRTSGHATISTTTSASVTNSTITDTELAVSATPPGTAAEALIILSVRSADGTGERHAFDTIALGPAVSTTTPGVVKDLSSTWAQVVSTFGIDTSQRAYVATPGGSGRGFATVDVGSVDMDFTGRLLSASTPNALTMDDTGWVFRYVDQNNYWTIKQLVGINAIRLVKCVAGALTVAKTFSTDLLANHTTCRVRAEGNNIQVWLDGVDKGVTPVLATDPQGTRMGLAAATGSTDPRWDNLAASALNSPLDASSNDLWRRSVDANGVVTGGKMIASSISPGGTWDDYTCRSGYEYEYRAVVHAVGGITQAGPWLA